MAWYRKPGGPAGNRSLFPYRRQRGDVKPSRFDRQFRRNSSDAGGTHSKGGAQNLDGRGDGAPPRHELERLGRRSKHDAQSQNPNVDIAAPTKQPNDAVKVAELIQRSAAGADDIQPSQSRDSLGAHQQQEVEKSTGQPAGAVQGPGNRNPPGVLEEGVEQMFKLADLRGFDFYPG